MPRAVPGRIRITSGEDEGRILEIEDELVLGRNRGDQGRIPDPEISRMHARVYVDADGGLAIEDLGSTNGTFVDGVRITEPWVLSPGHTLLLGQTTFDVEPPYLATTQERGRAVSRARAGGAAGSLRHHRLLPPSPWRRPPLPIRRLPQSASPPPKGTGVPRPLVAVLAGVLLLAALGIGAVLLFTGDDEDEPEPTTQASGRVQGPPALVKAATAAGCTAQDHPSEGRQHVQGTPKYRTNPPSSGPHAPQAAADGAWEASPPVPALVHSLEHGRIVMWHRQGDRKVVDVLREIGDEDSSKMILTPNTTGMPHRVAASAWGHVLGCPNLNGNVAGAIRAFRDAYRGKGPEFVP